MRGLIAALALVCAGCVSVGRHAEELEAVAASTRQVYLMKCLQRAQLEGAGAAEAVRCTELFDASPLGRVR